MSKWKTLSTFGILPKSKIAEWYEFVGDTVNRGFNRILPNPPQETAEEQGSYTVLNPSPVLPYSKVCLTSVCVLFGIFVGCLAFIITK
jgi:hypothetical protein|tara:strand:- start:682 stop:945 length:264 start_codon:yes stop_codon:yes gene_type:complete